MTKTFILGVGAQKAGTTWLHAYLDGRDDVDMGPRKEYHVFDAIAGLDPRISLDRLEQTIAPLRAARRTAVVARITRQIGFIRDPERYFDFFQDLAAAPGIRATGDITPSYAGLSGDVFSRIRDAFGARGLIVRPVFILRDPVDRLQSRTMMHFANQGVTPDLGQLVDEMRQYAGSDFDRVRSDYAHTVSTLDAVFPGAVHYAFYESFFDEDGLRALCAFLGLPFLPGSYDRRQRESTHRLVLPDPVRAEIAAVYAAQIAFCRDRFGARRVAAHWRSAHDRAG